MENGGLVDIGGGPQPSLHMETVAIYSEADLSRYTIQVWLDEAVDGVVDMGESSSCSVTASTADDCASSITNSLNLVVSGPLEPNTRYEFAVTVRDMSGLTSKPFVVPAITPRLSGEDGDGSGP